MPFDKPMLIEVVLTLTATGTLMWLVRRGSLKTGQAPLLVSLAGIAFLCGLYWLGLPSAGYILLALLALIAIAFLIGLVGEL